jgi:hypothetical protein
MITAPVSTMFCMVRRIWAYRLEGRDVLITVAIKILLRIVDCHSAFDVGGVGTLMTQLGIRVLGNTFVRAVRMFEVQGRCPIV